MRKTMYGTLTESEELDANEKALKKIIECAEYVGIEIIEGETAITIPLIAEIMTRMEEDMF